MDNKTLENQRVLIVDDQRAFQLMLKGILYSMGATNVAFAPSGEQALAKCHHNDFDILFVDYHLGIGKNGKQLLEDLREKKLLKPSSIFMMVTGENTVPMVVSAVELEPDDYLMKPFSQSVLRNRIVRLQNKKSHLSAMFQALHDELPERIVELCQQELSQNSRYQQFCKRVLIENLLKLQRFDEAKQLLAIELEQRRSGWALILRAKISLSQRHFTDCLALCEEAINENRYFAEAYDLMAQCYVAKQEPEQAFSCIKAAADIAPYSLSRQYLMLKIAHALHDVPAQVQASKQLYEITRRSMRQDIIHLLNYIRSVIDAASQADEPQLRNRYQQEALLALQRARRDEQLVREIDFDVFESLCQARLESVSGQQFQAKKSYAVVAEQAQAQADTIPDTVMLLNQIGEYEQASSLQQLISTDMQNNPVLKHLLTEQNRHAEQLQQRFKALNKEGIALYKTGQFSAALQRFELALELAPMNTGAALNYIQSALQILYSQQKSRPHELYEKCKKTFRIVDNMPLPEHHQQRYQELVQQFEKVRSGFKR
ncbi:response regulator [Arsukibacterium sp.]|uniref:response regulator n=1 Tax=Arsukibacterium sp. TaxID=1977258 RepID=UPI002FD9452B